LAANAGRPPAAALLAGAPVNGSGPPASGVDGDALTPAGADAAGSPELAIPDEAGAEPAGELGLADVDEAPPDGDVDAFVHAAAKSRLVPTINTPSRETGRFRWVNCRTSDPSLCPFGQPG